MGKVRVRVRAGTRARARVRARVWGTLSSDLHHAVHIYDIVPYKNKRRMNPGAVVGEFKTTTKTR